MAKIVVDYKLYEVSREVQDYVSSLEDKAERLSQRLEDMRRQLDEARALVRRLEWDTTDSDNDEFCSVCGEYRSEHKDDCKVKLFLKGESI